MMNRAWVFVKKEKGKKDRTEIYGSLREMFNSEKIVINGKMKSENGLRYLVKDRGEFRNEDYYISKKVINRSKNN